MNEGYEITARWPAFAVYKRSGEMYSGQSAFHHIDLPLRSLITAQFWIMNQKQENLTTVFHYAHSY